jgi:hypothetical protein
MSAKLNFRKLEPKIILGIFFKKNHQIKFHKVKLAGEK